MSALLRQMLADAPLNLWPMTETSGTAVADLGSAPVAGTIIGGMTPGAAQAVPGVPSPAWQARTASTDDDGVQLSSGFDLPNSSWTVTGWLYNRSDAVANGSDILSKDSVSPRGWVLARSHDLTQFSMESGGANVWVLTLPTALANNGRCHFALTWTSGTAQYRLLVDMVQQGTLNYPNIRAANAAVGNIGRRAYGGGATDSFNGSIGFLGVYGSVLSDARLAVHRDAGLRSGVVVG